VSGSLKTATSIVGLLAGIVAGVYVIGGVVIALRLLFDDFSFAEVATILGQLPREPVIATALLNVVAPAAAAGLVMAMWYGLRNRPKSRGGRSDDLVKGGRAWFLLGVLGLVAIGASAPAILKAHSADGWSLLFAFTVIFGIAVTFGIAAACWYGIRRVGREGWSRILRAACAGGLWAVILLTPSALLASARRFEDAQVCTVNAVAPLKGRLIGEGGSRVLLEQKFANEASVISVPSEQVTKTEYGDLSSTFTCPPPPGAKVAAKVAEAKLGRHGSKVERRLATEFRPRLRFNSDERWRPLAVDRFLGEHFRDGGGETACWRGPDPHCESIGLKVLRRGGEAPDFIDIHGDSKNGADYTSAHPNCLAEAPAVDCNEGPGAVMYYRRTSHEGRWYWDYWWLYRYNDYIGRFNDCEFYCADHEGDWEGMTVVTTATPQPEILGAIYATHTARVKVEAEILPRSGTHSLAFVAEGTHATYPFRCGRDCKQYATIGGDRLPEDDHNGRIAWGANVDAECAKFRCVRPLPEIGRPPEQSAPLAGGWAGWAGKWGSTCPAGCDFAESSPGSPGVQTRFKCPWTATRWGLLERDGTVSGSAVAGDAQRLLAVCGAQRGGL
jgi:hypothetical protein